MRFKENLIGINHNYKQKDNLTMDIVYVTFVPKIIFYS